MGSSYPLRKRRLLPTRVAPTWSFLTLTDSVFSFGFCRQALPQLLAVPLGLDSWGSATPFHAQAMGAHHSRLDGMVSLLHPPAHLAGPSSHASLPSFITFPMTRYSRFLADSLASSTELRLPARALFYVPKQNTRDTSGLVFRTLSAPLPLDSFQQLRFPFLVNLSLGTPR